MVRQFTVLVAAGLALGACAKTSSGQPPVTEAQAEKIAEAAEASFTSGDVNKIMDQYAEGATMIDASAPAPSTDRKVQTGWARIFTSMKPAGYEVVDPHIQVVGPDAFVSSGIERMTVESGSARPTVSARFTDVFQRQKDGQWKIVSEHVSIPPAPVGP